MGYSSSSSRQGPCAGARHRREDTALPDLVFPFGSRGISLLKGSAGSPAHLLLHHDRALTPKHLCFLATLREISMYKMSK